jgi:hypothetical protein
MVDHFLPRPLAHDYFHLFITGLLPRQIYHASAFLCVFYGMHVYRVYHDPGCFQSSQTSVSLGRPSHELRRNVISQHFHLLSFRASIFDHCIPVAYHTSSGHTILLNRLLL